jgi:hypothetical protein
MKAAFPAAPDTIQGIASLIDLMPHIYLMILPVLTVSTLPYQIYGQTDVRTTEPLAVIDPR